jgi:hypothetical protein
MHGEVINVYKILVKKPERKIPLGRPQHRWDNNIKMDLRETGLKGVDWIDVAQTRVPWQAAVNTVMNFRAG